VGTDAGDIREKFLMHRLAALVGRLLIATLSVVALFGPSTPIARANTESVNIVEPTDNPDDYAFDRTIVTIATGDTITWANKGLEIHTITADNGAFDSKDLDSNRTWSYTFAVPGTFTYYCDPHPWMQGTVIVN
jgi:plastocyanin